MASSPPSRAGSRSLTDFLLADIVGISADAIICVDEEQNITLFNDGAEVIFGWKAEEIIGKPLDLLLPERIRDVHHKHIERFKQAPEGARKMGQRSEISGLRKNGEEFPAEAAIAKVAMGNQVVFSVLLRDITEQMALRKRLQRAVTARDETVGVVAHDLRNPVSAVKMLSAALLQRGPDRLRDDVRVQLELIRDAALQMDHLIQDLLDVTRVEAGRMTVDTTSISAQTLLENALKTLRPLVEQAGLTLKVDIPASLPNVSADQARVSQVLSNLVGNAIKFTSKGGSIQISARREANDVAVSVRDSGMGISPELLPFVFERFFQAGHSAIRSRGAGLGLPIARGIIEAHGGRITAESEQGKGATFTFTLPLGSRE